MFRLETGAARSRKTSKFSLLVIALLSFFLWLAVALYPRIKAVSRYTETCCHISDRQLLFDHLIDCLDFEFVGITWVAHGTS